MKNIIHCIRSLQHYEQNYESRDRSSSLTRGVSYESRDRGSSLAPPLACQPKCRIRKIPRF